MLHIFTLYIYIYIYIYLYIYYIKLIIIIIINIPTNMVARKRNVIASLIFTDIAFLQLVYFLYSIGITNSAK